MLIYGQSPADIAATLLATASAGETITVGDHGYTEAQTQAVIDEIWRQHGQSGLTIKGFNSVIGVLHPDQLFHGKPVQHLANVFDPIVEVEFDR
jgi:hypothetical protein